MSRVRGAPKSGVRLVPGPVPGSTPGLATNLRKAIMKKKSPTYIHTEKGEAIAVNRAARRAQRKRLGFTPNPVFMPRIGKYIWNEKLQRFV